MDVGSKATKERGLFSPDADLPVLIRCTDARCQAVVGISFGDAIRNPQAMSNALAGAGWSMTKARLRVPLAGFSFGFIPLCPQHPPSNLTTRERSMMKKLH